MNATEQTYQPRGAMAQLFKWALVDKKFPQGEIVELLLEGPAGTGKSRCTGELAYHLMEAYPKSRGLVVRKTRKALSESWMVTFEDKVLWPGHPMIGSARRQNRHGYEHENGSELVMGTMETPENLYSTEWDWVLFEEAQQSDLDSWEKFKRSLRNNKMPFQLLIASVNPDRSSHFLNKRASSPAQGVPAKMHRLITRHVDNPSLRPAYLQSLSELTGVRYRRLFLGEWCEAEGAIFPEYDTAKHLAFSKTIPYHPAIHGESGQAPRIRAFYGAVDFGYNDPGVINVFGIDGDNVLWQVAEVYQTKQGIPYWADTIAALDKRYRFERIFCDPSQPAMIDLFNVSLGQLRGRTGAAEGVACKAANEWQAGIEAVRERLIGTNGKPTLMLRHDALVGGRDPLLAEASRPCCTADELPEYVYKKDVDGKPQKGRDRDCEDPSSVAHGIDTLRYLCLSLMRADERAIPKRPGYEPGTYGDIAKHWEIFDDDLGLGGLPQ